MSNPRKPMSTDDMTRFGASWWSGAPTPAERLPEQREPQDGLRPIAVHDIAQLWRNRPELLDLGESNALPVCTGCGGAGFYLEAVPFGHPHFGRQFPCECKIAETQAATRAILMRASGLDSVAWRDKTFATFKPSVKGMSKAFRRAESFAARPHGFLSFFGGTGCGKTHLSGAIAHQVLAQQASVYIATVPDMLDYLRSGYNKESSSYEVLMTQLRDVQLLVLDDLGTQSPTPWSKEKLFQIVNHRYAYQLPMVVTCNARPEDIDPRILSRLQDKTLAPDGIIAIEAADYRRREQA